MKKEILSKEIDNIPLEEWDSLIIPFYLNVLVWPDGGIEPVGDYEYCGSNQKHKAISLRKKFWEEKLGGKEGAWKYKDLKTVKVSIFKYK